MLYTANELNNVLREIIRYGIEVDPAGVAHKRNMLDPSAPKLPIKIHLCTAEIRPRTKPSDPRLPPEVVVELGRLMWLYLKHHHQTKHAPLPAISGIPRVGTALADAIQAAAQRDSIELEVIKTIKVDGVFKIVPTLKKRSIIGIDDLINYSDTKVAATRAWRSWGYVIEQMLVCVDYERGGSQSMAHDWGVKVDSLASVHAPLQIAQEEPALNPELTSEIIAQVREMLVRAPSNPVAA